MLSGIGPADELLKHKIKQLVDLPVGKYLTDHPVIDLIFGDVHDHGAWFLRGRNFKEKMMTLREAFRWKLGGVGFLTSNVGRLFIDSRV